MKGGKQCHESNHELLLTHASPDGDLARVQFLQAGTFKDEFLPDGGYNVILVELDEVGFLPVDLVPRHLTGARPHRRGNLRSVYRRFSVYSRLHDEGDAKPKQVERMQHV